MSVFKGRNFEMIVFIACFDIFQLKTLAKADIIHDFTEISSISLFISEICSLSQNSHISHTQLAIVLALTMFISNQC